jgi:hypothetical protein
MAQPKPPDHVKKKVQRAVMAVYCDVDQLVTEVWSMAYGDGYNKGYNRGYSDCQADVADKPRAGYSQ